MSGDPSRPARLAVFHLNQVGDLVFSLPALAALRAGFPDARRVSVVRETVAPLLEGSPLVDAVLTHHGSRDFLATAQALREESIDLAICLSESPRSRLLAFLTGAPRRIGLGGGPLGGLLTGAVERVGLPSTANDLRVVRALGCPVPTESYVGLLAAGEEDRAEARRLLVEAGAGAGERLVALAPEVSSGREGKAWPVTRFAEVARALGARGGLTVAVVGASPGGCFETPPPGCVDLAGRTTLRQLLGLLSLAELFVGNDSGALHLAACLGVRCLALYGPTDPAETGPQGGPHTVLRAPGGDLTRLPATEVTESIESLLTASRVGASAPRRGSPPRPAM
jgi:ADP-heptose:LPS heptosyltransferase